MKKNNLSVWLTPLALLTMPLVVTACSNSQPGTGSPTSQNSASDQVATTYKDGIYSSVGDYMTPGGQEEIGVKVTLANNIITDVQVQTMAVRRISKEKQTAFAENYKPLVVGKNINEVQLFAVAGASLTPQGFNDALNKIKKEAV